jgi:hypothetical protein
MSMTYSLASLQARRSDANAACDWAAYWAFDLLIGHVLGEPAMYARQNQALASAMPDYVEDVFGIHEERRRHP